MNNFGKLPEDVAESVRRSTAEIVEKRLNRAQEYDIYSEFVESQKEFFQKDVYKILRILEKLIMEGKLYIYTRLTSRIKDPESALHNDDLSKIDNSVLAGKMLEELQKEDYTIIDVPSKNTKYKDNKALDDVFGITIITDTEEEIQILLEELRKNFCTCKEKKMNKPKYHATHMFLWGDESNPKSPMIECQLKTMRDHINSYDHTFYKIETNFTRKLQEQHKIELNQKVSLNEKGKQKVKNLIQEYYNNNGFSIFTNIPRMWEATFNEKTETMEIARLSEAQALKRVYPSLVVRSDKSR